MFSLNTFNTKTFVEWVVYSLVQANENENVTCQNIIWINAWK